MILTSWFINEELYFSQSSLLDNKLSQEFFCKLLNKWVLKKNNVSVLVIMIDRHCLFIILIKLSDTGMGCNTHT